MKTADLKLIVVAVVVVAVIVAGELGTYHPPVSYSSDADPSGDWSVNSSGTFTYDALLLDSGTVTAPEGLMIYYDATYGSKVNDGLVEVGARALNQDYYISQLRNNLAYLGVSDVTVVSADTLKSNLSDPTYSRYGLVCLSGALPDTVYDGTSTCEVITWLSNGGTLYWAGQQLGMYVGHSDGTVTEAPSGHVALFLGADDCLNPAEQNAEKRAGTATRDVTANNLRYALSMKNNNVLYAVDTSKLTAGTYLSAGYCEGDYVSTCIVRNGDGQVCVMGGDFSNHQRMDLASVIASGLCWSSTLVDWSTGTVSHGTVSGSFDTTVTSGHKSVFLVLGGDFAVYGRNYEI